MRRGKHHLFDDIENNAAITDSNVGAGFGDSQEFSLK
jgi:hypothetical protein